MSEFVNGQRVVYGRMPEFIPNVAEFADIDTLPPISFEIGTYLSTPVLMNDGQVYGTLKNPFSGHPKMRKNSFRIAFISTGEQFSLAIQE